VLATVSAIASGIGARHAYRMIVRNEQRNCDARLDAYRQGRADEADE
jgi:hypothetical protein